MRFHHILMSLSLGVGLLVCGCAKPSSESISPTETAEGKSADEIVRDPGGAASTKTALTPEAAVAVTQADASPAPIPTAAETERPEVTSPPDTATLPRKEMLKLVGSGVVLVTTFDALGQSSGIGSGCIVGDGLVLTNHHVVAEAITAKVQVKGDGDALLGKELPVLGYRAIDDRNDLILLQVEDLPSHLYTFSIPDSDGVEQHDQVFSMGHPDGLKFSTSPGFVNAMLKTSDMPEQLRLLLRSLDTEWIQTDAVISGGSSGGPLVNEQGQLVGVSTIRIPDSRIAFAVAARHIRDIVSQTQQTQQTHQTLTALPLPDADVIATRALAEVKAGFDREFQQFALDVRRQQMSTDVKELEQLIRRNNPGPACLLRCCQLAEKFSGQVESADALKVCSDVLHLSRSLPNSGRQYLDQLLRKASVDRSLIPVSPGTIGSMDGLPYSAELEIYLRRLIESESDAKVQAAAGIVLVHAMAAEDTSKMKPEMLDLASDLISRFGSERFQGVTVQETLDPLIQQEKFSIGSVAPEISGTDHGAEAFRLSDYRGKVVVLDFWADWCPHCRNMYPHERELVERFHDKPFALLGINGDEPDRARQVIEAGTVTWRSWMDGPQGPIAEQYRIEAWPTLLVLDGAGRIRFKDVRGQELEAAVESLLEISPRLIPQNLLALEANWKFRQLTSAEDVGRWNQTDFNDSDWPSGSGPFGYEGAGSPGTGLPKLPIGTRPLTTLFRKTFDLPDASLPEYLLMKIQYRDGIAVCINGTEVYRGQLRADAVPGSSAVFRGTDRQSGGIAVPVRSDLFRPKGNCIAASLHQYSVYSTDLQFSLSLGTPANPAEMIDGASASVKSDICRLVAQAGIRLPDAAMVVEKLQGDPSDFIKVAAAVAAAMNELPITISGLQEMEAQQQLFTQILQMHDDCRNTVEMEGMTADQYDDALRMARAAYLLKSKVDHQLKPHLRGIENTYGVALYRLGQYQKSTELLQESMAEAGENPVDIAYLALSHHRLGNADELQKYQTRLNELLRSEEWLHDADAQAAAMALGQATTN